LVLSLLQIAFCGLAQTKCILSSTVSLDTVRSKFENNVIGSRWANDLRDVCDKLLVAQRAAFSVIFELALARRPTLTLIGDI
jgi:hypothetical protein